MCFYIFCVLKSITIVNIAKYSSLSEKNILQIWWKTEQYAPLIAFWHLLIFWIHIIVFPWPCEQLRKQNGRNVSFPLSCIEIHNLKMLIHLLLKIKNLCCSTIWVTITTIHAEIRYDISIYVFLFIFLQGIMHFLLIPLQIMHARAYVQTYLHYKRVWIYNVNLKFSYHWS